MNHKLLSYCLVLFMFSLIFPVSYSNADYRLIQQGDYNKYSFRGVNFYQSSELLGSGYLLKNCSVVENDKYCIYHKLNEKLTLGDASLSKVEYHFYNDMFYKVICTAEEGNNNELKLYQSVKKALSSRSATDSNLIWKVIRTDTEPSVFMIFDAAISSKTDPSRNYLKKEKPGKPGDVILQEDF